MKAIWMMVLLAAARLSAVLPATGWAQIAQPIYAIDKPTAGILPHGMYLLRARTGPESSFLTGLRVGFGDILHFGVSFGMQRVFERGDPTFNDHVGFQVRARLIPETAVPALAAGFDSQGLGVYHEGAERYDRKSPGVYVILSKNYTLVAGDLSLHGGVSWSTERRDDDDPNVFAGADLTVLQRLSFLLDADAALNDNTDDGAFGRGGIYLDAGIRLYYGESIVMTLVFRDLSGNFAATQSVGREFELAFVEFF